jgi:hypothetical protein
MDELEYITKDALMMCDQGGAPDFFKPTYNTTVEIHGCLVATNTDAAPIVNIPSFKVCKKTGGPCIPKTAPNTWKDTWQVKVKGSETLIGKSTCPCPVGGKVEFMTSGQVPLPADAAAEVKALQDQAQRELDDSGQGNSVGETGFVEGMIPVWGSGRDMINDIQTGDVGGTIMNAGFLVWDVASIVVGVFSFGTGTVAMQGIKAGVKGAVKTAAKAISKEALQQLGKQALKKLSKEALKKSIDDVAKKLLKSCVFACFPAGTPVHTEHGLKNIEDIQVGDRVWAFNEETKEIALQEVVHTMQNETDHTISLYTEKEVIETTATHPFYVNGAWKDASELQAGDKILTQQNETAEITDTKFSYIPKKVYNFEVAQWHTYFVGGSSFLVHNSGGKCVSELLKEGGEMLAKTWDDLAKFKHCFLAGTMVKTKMGDTPIEQLRDGQEIYAYDFEKSEPVLKRIIKTYNSHTDFIIEFTCEGETIRCTRKHRIWVDDEKGWVEAGDLKKGMRLQTFDGKSGYVEAIHLIEQPANTYNLEVEDAHNYFVSSFGVLVHNGNPFPNSVFNDLTTRQTEIYRYFDPVTKETQYVGKTVQGLEKRAGQHAREKGLQALVSEGKLGYEVIDKGKWNAFQTAAREQHYISKFGTKGQKAGAHIWNKINALSKAKFDHFSKLIKCP